MQRRTSAEGGECQSAPTSKKYVRNNQRSFGLCPAAVASPDAMTAYYLFLKMMNSGFCSGETHMNRSGSHPNHETGK
jgi:hypothetical protein